MTVNTNIIPPIYVNSSWRQKQVIICFINCASSVFASETLSNSYKFM